MAGERQAPKNVFNASWLFGHPVARADNNSAAKWVRPTTSPLYQKGGGWMVELVGGVQTGDDWAACYIPVNEYPVRLFVKAQWSYYMTATESFGINIVVWIHDPDDFDKRAEVTQMGSVSGLEKSSGWNAHELNTATTQFFFYGENTSGTSLTAGTQYTWAQFQADNLFKNWVIYRVSLEFGWQASGTFNKAYLAEVKLNEVPIPLIPPQLDALDELSIVAPMFGKPSIMANGSSRATWVKGTVSPFDQKGGSGWVAQLYGGAQSGDDWARVNVPVNEMPTPDLLSAQWSYHMSASDVYGCNMVVWVHDPTNFDKRAEITQSPTITGLVKTSGWNAHALNVATDQFWFMGEGTSGTGISVFPSLSGWDDFQADVLFSTWTIYRISFEFGWYNTGTFGTATVADIEINGQIIPLRPTAEETLFDKLPILKEVRTAVDIGSTDCSTFAAGDIMGNDDCCTTTAVAWTFTEAARVNGGYGRIMGATLVSDMEDQTVQYDLLLFNATPTNTLLSNSVNDNPQKEDISLYLGTIVFPESTARGADVATYTQATPASTSTNIPMPFKCAVGDDDIYGVLVTRTGYTHTDDDTIEIALLVEQW